MSTQEPLTTGSANPGATDRSREVAGHARSEVEETAGTAADKARDVADTARSEVRDVVDEARDAVRRQADEQSRAAAGTMAKFRDDLKAMSGGGSPSDTTAEYLQRAAGSLDGVIDRIERDGIEGALSGVRRFAQRSPGGFLLASAGAGFAVARLIRNADHPQQVAEEQSADTDASRAGQSDRPEIDLTSSDTDVVEDSRYDASTNRIYADGGARR